MKFLLGIRNNVKRLWYSVIYMIVNFIVIFGLVCPYLISYDDDAMVFIGVFVFIADISHLMFFFVKLIKSFNLNKNENEKNS